jgi:Trp operon repressor
MLRNVMAGKVSPKKLQRQEKELLRESLLKALQRIGQEKDMGLVLEILTESEQVMLARRIQVAKHLLAGESQGEIRAALRVGQATVESVDRWLRGRFEEYRQTLPTLYKETREREVEERRGRPIEPYSFRWLRRKYPLHFLLFNLLLDDIPWGHRQKGKPRRPSYTAIPKPRLTLH